MNAMARPRITVALLAATAASLPAPAQNAPVVVDIGACVAVESAVERLDCYDRLARDAARGPIDSSPAAFRVATAAARAGSEGNEATPPLEEITSEIVALREIQPGRLEIALANGQVWRQTHSDRYRLEIGYRVKVYRTRPGAQYFRLTAPAIRGFAQVERVR
jgi:hypothetical protein